MDLILDCGVTFVLSMLRSKLQLGPVLVAGALLASCSDPAGVAVAVDAPGEGASETTAPSLVGRAWIGAPVRGAKVEVFAYDDLVRGVTFGETITNIDGRFGMPMPEFQGRIVIRISGTEATYRNPITLADERLGESDELFATVVLGPSLAGRELQVDLLTTLSTSYALSLRNLEGPDRATSLAVERFAQHIHPDVFDATETPRGGGAALVWPSPEAAVTLFHMGLHEVWAETLAASGTPRPGPSAPEASEALSFVAFSRALRRDIRDGVFDGLEHGQPAWSSGPVLDAEPTRTRLAEAAKRWNDAQDGWTGLTTAELTSSDGFCTLVSTDVGPLYPSGTPGPGGPYDPLPPTLTFEPPTPASGAALASDFVVRARATDPGGLSAVELTGVLLGPAPMIDLGSGTYEVTVPAALNDDGELTLVLSATDRAGNTAHLERVVRLDTTPPALEVNLDGAPPVGPTLLSSVDLSLDGTVSDSGSGLAALFVGPAEGAPVAVPFPLGVYRFDTTLTEGPHTLELEATDLAGNATLRSVSVIVDLSGPTVDVLAPADQGLVGPTTFEVLVAADDPAGPVSVDVRSVGGAWLDAAPLDDGRHRVELTSPPSDGAFAFDVRARDAAGHETLESASAVRDGTPPLITKVEVLGAIDSPVPGRFWTAATEAAIRVHVADANGIASVDVGGVPAAPSGATWSALVPVAGGDLNVVTVAANDPVQNQAQLSLELGRDLTPPTCTLNALPGSGWTAASSLIVDGATMDAGVGVASVVIEGGLSAAPALVIGNAYQSTVLLPASDTELRARCTDALGNATSSAPVPIRVDRKVPLVTIDPADGAHLNVNVAPVELGVSEQSGVARAELRTNGGEFLPATLVDEGTPYSDWRFHLDLPLAELDGLVTVEYRVEDLAGNITQGQISYEKDASAPVFGAVDVVGAVVRSGVHYVREPVATVRVALLDAPGAVGGVRVGGVPAALAGGSYQALVDLQTADTNPISIPLLAWDLAGNERSGAVWIARDTTPPTCQLDAPDAGGYTKASELTLKATAEDDGAQGVSIRVVLGDAVGPATSAPEGSFDVLAGPLPPGSTFVSLLCQDALGNALASSAVLVHRDLDAPVVSDCTPSTGAVIGAAPFELSCRVDDVDPELTVTTEPQTLGFGPAGTPVALALSGGRYRAVIPGFGALMTQSGPARLHIKARDRAGSAGDLDLDLAVDLAPPAITGLTATPGIVLPGGEVAVRSGAVAVAVSAADVPAGIAHVRIGHPNAGLPGPSDAAELQAGAYVAQRNVAAPGGELIVALEDTVGNRTDASLELRVDDTPPACTLVSPLGPTTVAKDDVDLVIHTQDDLAGGANAVPFRAGLAAGPQAAGPTTSLVVSGLVEGPNDLWARCSDALGNGQESAHVVVTRDSLPPVIQVLSPAEGAFVSPAGGLVVAKVTDAGALGAVSVRRQGAEAIAATEQGGAWQAAFTTPLQADGEFWVDVLASDAVGNATSKRITLRRDGTPPVLGSPDVDGAVVLAGVYWVRGPLALIRLPATDLGSGVTAVTIGGKPAALQGGAYEASVPVGSEPLTVTVGATDGVGNTASAQLVLRVDADPPTCELQYPSDQKKWRNVTGPFGVHVQFEDTGVGADGIDFDVDGVLSTGVPAMLAEGVYIPNMYLGWANLSGPSHHLMAICRDRLGNTQSSPVLELGVDLVPPTIPTVIPASGSFVRSGTFMVSATFTDALSGLAKLKFSDGGEVVTPTGPPFPSPASATFTIPGSAMSYSVAIYADDYAGNSASKTASYTVDNTAPTLTTPTAVAGSVLVSGVRWVASTTASVTAVVADPAGVSQVKFGSVIATLKPSHDGTVTATATLSDVPVTTPKVYEVRATDTLGNVQLLESVTLRADTTPPTCTLTDPADGYWTSDPAQVVRVESTDTGIQQVAVTLDGGIHQDFPAAFQGGSYAAALTLSGEEVDFIQATCKDALGNTAQSGISAVHFDNVPPTIVILPTTAADHSNTTVLLAGSPPILGGNIGSVAFSETSCTQAGGCPLVSRWSHLTSFQPGESLNMTQIPFLAVGSADDRGLVMTSYSTIGLSGATILNERPMIPAISSGLVVGGVPLTPYYLTDSTVSAASKWPTKIRLTAVDRAGNMFERTIPIQVKLLPSPMRTTVMTGAAAPDLAGLSTAGALSSAFSVNPTAPWSTFGGIRVLHVEVENPYGVDLPVAVDLAGTVRLTRDIARRLPTTTVLESCVAQTCAVGLCRVGTQCAAIGTQPSYSRSFDMLTQWRPKSSYGTDSPVLPMTDGALLIPAKTKRYLSFVAPTPSTCFVLPAKPFGSKTAYPNPQLGSTCTAPLTLSQPSALCSATTSPCQNLKGDLLELIERVQVEGSHNYGTNAAVLPARVVAAVPGAPTPTVQSTLPGFPLDWSLNVAP
ncbi:MAG: hypothetical protein IV100_07725 [Myxococcales bacterium]|nr:hypothetical protein [Myxococcales bacterium]